MGDTAAGIQRRREEREQREREEAEKQHRELREREEEGHSTVTHKKGNDQKLTWFKSQRTHYGKLTQSKSDQAPKEMIERQNWIQGKFNLTSEERVSTNL